MTPCVRREVERGIERLRPRRIETSLWRAPAWTRRRRLEIGRAFLAGVIVGAAVARIFAAWGW